MRTKQQSGVPFGGLEKKKGKEDYLYSAFIQRLDSDMDHTLLPANYTMPAFPS